MRESIGGTWIFGIVALFIALFSGFLAYSISYTKAFKAKNEIINLIERSEGFTGSKNGQLGKEDDMSVENQAYLLLKNLGYNTSEINCGDYGTFFQGGYCVKRNISDTAGNKKVYYKITTFIKVELPIIEIDFKIPIMGETTAMYYETSNIASELAD